LATPSKQQSRHPRNVDAYRPIPKVEMHCHLLGAVAATTVVELGIKHDVPLRTRDPGQLYVYYDFLGLVDILTDVAATLKEEEDFSRIAYEVVKKGYEQDRILYRELFFQPSYHALFGVPYRTVIDGLVDGIQRAEREFDTRARLIAGINRQLPGRVAYYLVEEMIAHSSEYVIGIGLEDYELYGPPDMFVEAYELAHRHGLHRTAHAGEHGPAENVVRCLSRLKCERIDHGYHLTDDPSSLYRLAENGVHFTVCPTVCNRQGWSRPEGHVLKRMHEAGLWLSVNTDDPVIVRTSLSREYALAADAMDLSVGDMADLALRAIDATWLDDSEKAALRQRFEQETSALDLTPAAS